MRVFKSWAGGGLGLMVILSGAGETLPPSQAQTPASVPVECPAPLLKRLKRHAVKGGETIASIAALYQLVPNTLLSLNPQYKTKAPLSGQIVLIPPFNGQRVTVPAGGTWKDLAKIYGVRADLLYEVNGCVLQPREVFVPGVAWNARTQAQNDNYGGLPRSPLTTPSTIALDYGWQKQKGVERSFFHSGIDLLAPLDSPVVAAGGGTVILVSQEGPYGFLVVIDHGKGRQSRYAHLSRFAVAVDQVVPAGAVVGYVGQTGRPDVPQPHVHFEVRFQSPAGWIAQDPKLHLPQGTLAAPPSR